MTTHFCSHAYFVLDADERSFPLSNSKFFFRFLSVDSVLIIRFLGHVFFLCVSHNIKCECILHKMHKKSEKIEFIL